MNNLMISIEIPEGRVKQILDKLTEAQETIWQCYRELEDLGIVTIRERTGSGN